MSDDVNELRALIAEVWGQDPGALILDGKIHRSKPKDFGWYVGHEDTPIAGCAGNWRTGETRTWCSKSDNDMSPAERSATRERVKATQRMRDAEAARRNSKAAEKASRMWAAGIPAISHPYLIAKRVKAHGLRTGTWQKWDRDTGEITMIQNVLYVPMRDTAGELMSLQGITTDGEKLFLAGGKVKGAYHSIGRPSERLIIAEGMATAAVVYEATNDGVAVAFSSGNLEPVARALRSKYPCLPIVIAADDDYQSPGNPGLTAARAAAAAVGGLLAIPNFSGLPRGPKDTDFADLARLAGSVKVEVLA